MSVAIIIPPPSHVIGLEPWLPWPLCRSRWWTDPVPAQRLAALRLGVAAAMLFDLLLTYLPYVPVFFGRGSLGSPELTGWLCQPPFAHWSVLSGIEAPAVLLAAMLLWLLAAVSLLLGWQSRLSAVVAWLLSLSFANLNPYVINAGDHIRCIILFHLMLTPCGAAWSLDRWLRQRRQPDDAPVLIHPWPLRLLFVQLVAMYFCSGLSKLVGHDWVHGTSLYYVLGDLTLARFSYAQLQVPHTLTRVQTWLVLFWEVGFPLWISLTWTRTAALFLGVAFHLGIFLTMEIGAFPLYVLALYLPFISWPASAGQRRNAESQTCLSINKPV